VRRTKNNGFMERLHRTLLDEHFRIQGRQIWYESVEEMQKSLESYFQFYNRERPHQGRGMNGKTPYTTFLEGLPPTSEANTGETDEAA
jgi:transposase InsO family protein